MAAQNNPTSVAPLPKNNETLQITPNQNNDNNLDYSQRGQWLRAAILGANDGLVSTASLIMGVGAIKHDARAMILAGFAGLVAGACSMAIGEFVSVYAQLDIEVAQKKREYKTKLRDIEARLEKETEREEEREALPNPYQAALASALAFTVGALMPLLGATFIQDHKVRMIVVVAVVSLALVIFGVVGAVLGKARVLRSCVRVVVGGWLAMAITFGLTKLISSLI